MLGFDFIVLGKAPVAAQPGKGSLHDPTMREHLKAAGGLLDDLDLSRLADALGLEPLQEFASVPSIGPNLAKPAEPGCLFQKKLGSVSVLGKR